MKDLFVNMFGNNAPYIMLLLHSIYLFPKLFKEMTEARITLLEDGSWYVILFSSFLSSLFTPVVFAIHDSCSYNDLPFHFLKFLQVSCFAHDVLPQRHLFERQCFSYVICSLWFMFPLRKRKNSKTLAIGFCLMEAIFCSICWSWLTCFLFFTHSDRKSKKSIYRWSWISRNTPDLSWCLRAQLCVTISRMINDETTFLAKIILSLNFYLIIKAMNDEGTVSHFFSTVTRKYLSVKRNIYANWVEERRRVLLCEVIEDLHNVKIIEEMAGKVDENSTEVVANVGLGEFGFLDMKRVFRKRPIFRKKMTWKSSSKAMTWKSSSKSDFLNAYLRRAPRCKQGFPIP